MKHQLFTRCSLLLIILILFTCCRPEKDSPEFSSYQSKYQVENGKPFSVMLTSYKTTMLADGKDQTSLNIAIIDSTSHQITSSSDSIRIYLFGGGKLVDANGNDLAMKSDTADARYVECRLTNGKYSLYLVSDTKPGHSKVEARSGDLLPGAHEIHMISPDFKLIVPSPDRLPATSKGIPDMIGADISFLPQIKNERNQTFYDREKEIDPIAMLHNHGFNTIRLRLFVNPENEKGYSPGKGYCGLDSTLSMAHRVKGWGMKLLLDFHYSDYWADPQQQNKPLAWKDLEFELLTDSMKVYTSKVISIFKEEGVLPDMVQIGNEINHGLLWPDGHIGNPDQLAALLIAGVEGVREIDPSIPIMMHIALGGQNDEAVFWLNNMIARGVEFDIVGLSYYPRWHGTLDDLNTNLRDLVQRYNKPVNVVEYNNYKREVHDIVFDLPDGMGKGAFIWEPLGRFSGLFNEKGETTSLIGVYDSLRSEYLIKK